MSDAKDRPLFDRSVAAQLRAALRDDFGYSQEELDEIPSKMLGTELEWERTKRELHEEHRAALPRWVGAGYLTQDEAAKLSRYQLRQLAKEIETLEEHRTDKLAERPAPLKARPREAGAVVPDLSRAETLALLAKTVAVVAAQQAVIAELRDQVATVHNAQVGVLGEQRLVELLTNAERDFEGIEVEMRLEETSALSSESTIAGTEETERSLESARDASAAIEGLASYVVGLNAGGEINISELERAVRTLREKSKRQANVRSKGEVKIKFKKIIRGKSSD